MAAISISSIISYRRQVHPTVNRMLQIERDREECYLPFQKDFIYPSPCLNRETNCTWNVSRHASDHVPKAKGQQVTCLFYSSSSLWRKTNRIPLLETCNAKELGKSSSGLSPQRDKICYESSLLVKGRCEGQLVELDSYFCKLHYTMNGQHGGSADITAYGSADITAYHMESSSRLEGTKADVASNPYKKKSTLNLLENYFGELNAVERSEKGTSLSLGKEISEGALKQMRNSLVGGYHENMSIVEPNGFERLRNIGDEASHADNGNIIGLHKDDDASDFYLINILVAINIAIFLFEIASPIRNSEIQNLSLPLAYGAKINKLILIGEWWRLLTPMFLHSGFLHVSLSCWVLLTFGPPVFRRYGPFTFLLIYMLGGISGNLTSFIHTPELTVCGTGPVFAVIGAWLVYQIQNKLVVSKELSESMFWKAVTATALSFLLSCFGRIDDWTHLGAAFAGIIFGYLTCPALQLLNNSVLSKDGQKQESITLVHRQADPCKSLLVFIMFMLILSSLVIFYEPQIESLEMEDFFNPVKYRPAIK